MTMRRGRRTAVLETTGATAAGSAAELLQQCRRALDEGTVLLAQDAGAVVGVAVLRLDPRAAEIRALVTEPTLRHRGIGRVLVLEMARRARAAGCERLRIHLARSDDAAVGFFLALGFEDTHVALDLVL